MKSVNHHYKIKKTDYAGSFIYENNSLKQFYHSEGYVENNAGNFEYVYQYRDIWKNVRLSYADTNGDGAITQNEIRREQNYYPGGLEHVGYNGTVTGVKSNFKQYQGQEFTEDLGLNTHEWKFRMSDPAELRFWQIDPLAEKYTYNSTYAFQENKLGMGTELEGKELKEWFNSLFNNGGNYEAVSIQTIQAFKSSTNLRNAICTIGCHNIQFTGESVDLAGIVRDAAGKVGLGATVLDAGTDAFGKASLFGKYSAPLALTSATISVFADSQSESTSGEFTANTIQTTIETAVGLKNPALSLGLHINFEDAKSSEGLTNLSNGRMSNAYSSSQKQIQNYLKKNFNNKGTNNNLYINSYKGGNKFDYAIYYLFTFQWSKLDNLRKDTENKEEEIKKNRNE